MFNEKDIEMGLPVWQSPKYKESKEKALEIINSGLYGVAEGDFWILMNKTRNGEKMAYTGLIISHNGCLKINEKLENKVNPHCFQLDKEGYAGALVYTYVDDDVYEVGEVTKENCKNAYPYAMAYKRCFDRVVLKKSKLAFSGIYSEVEADEFKQVTEEPKQEPKKATKKSIQEVCKWLKNKEFMSNAPSTIDFLKNYCFKEPKDLDDATEEVITKLREAITKDFDYQQNAKLTDLEKAGIY